MNKEVFLKLSLISKGVIAICALVGFLMEMFLHGWHSIRYYTNQSNLLVVIFLIYLLLKYRKEGDSSNWTGVSFHASSFKNTRRILDDRKFSSALYCSLWSIIRLGTI